MSLFQSFTHTARVLDIEMPHMELSLLFRREGSYYLLNFVFPMIVMWLLAYATFFLPFEEHDRVSIIMSVVWTITAIMFLTADARPNNFQDSWIDTFQAGSLVICVFPALEAVLVARLKTHVQERIDHTQAVYEHARAMYKAKMRQMHLQALRNEYEIKGQALESFQHGEALKFGFPMNQDHTIAGRSLGRDFLEAKQVFSFRESPRHLAAPEATMIPVSSMGPTHPAWISRRASITCPNDVAKGLALFRQRMMSGTYQTSPGLSNPPGLLAHIQSFNELNRNASLAGEFASNKVLQQLSGSPRVGAPQNASIWQTTDTLRSAAERPTVPPSVHSSVRSDIENFSEGSSWDEYDAFLPPPPQSEDAGILSNIIDHVFQVGYPGCMAVFLIERLSPMRVRRDFRNFVVRPLTGACLPD
eukprot:Gregarina_sp_Poly_1__8063@NODE_463_length_8191_cov_61_524372_g377_i0_p4_GENE_NODE_463_length_8191_cov_61_524372_g377_i0NODE_463_length_8191_cov_61_524372_g377_i0_p4_ORF_typecomplete_len417_score53_68Neur_chan_memb/PF02932_16/1_4e067TMRDISM_7TM/PF07695_11/0_127TMRDISM_7TM/PF07695_11/6_4e03DUF2569/PF10754_9/0_44_NODE_463_length_8191_cov_61_524372_g377_i015492799